MIRKRVFVNQGESVTLFAMVRDQTNSLPIAAADSVAAVVVAADGTETIVDPPAFAFHAPPQGSVSSPVLHWNTAIEDADGYNFSQVIAGDLIDDSDFYEARITITAGSQIHRLVFEISVRAAQPVV